MKSESCDSVRELLPELAGGRLHPAERAAAERHMAACVECADERVLIEGLVESRPVPPAGLEDRVLAAVRARPASRRWGSPAQLAMAATLAAAVIGGAVLIDGAGLRERAGEPSGDSGAAVLLPGVVDPLLRGSLLPELTEAELETLLAEMKT